MTAAFSQSCMSPEVSTLAEPEDALGLASEEEDEEEESVEVVQAARPRAMEPTAAAAKIRPMGRIGFPFVGGGSVPAFLGGEPALVHGCNWDG